MAGSQHFSPGDIQFQLITTLSAKKRVRNYSEFTWKRIAKKTGP